jgi:hypothetical protein
VVEAVAEMSLLIDLSVRYVLNGVIKPLIAIIALISDILVIPLKIHLLIIKLWWLNPLLLLMNPGFWILALQHM